MRVKDSILNMADTIKKNFQGTAGSNFGIQLPQRSGSSISRIGKGWLFLFDSFFIELFKGVMPDEDFTPDFEPGGEIG